MVILLVFGWLYCWYYDGFIGHIWDGYIGHIWDEYIDLFVFLFFCFFMCIFIIYNCYLFYFNSMNVMSLKIYIYIYNEICIILAHKTKTCIECQTLFGCVLTLYLFVFDFILRARMMHISLYHMYISQTLIKIFKLNNNRI